ncbi:hypothetical protein J2744_000708 [Halorubrum trapanicum]|uniref:DUF7718 domain-containing protein n=1 Tax=Halorubrum trapanicum TaxID=29284 RepID=A0A8J7UMU9_9EURY|nr:hypothetical protein [Halorubrum trapanicum]MBP1901050.1 hypothetical protein [Halorubrum trapanicum]
MGNGDVQYSEWVEYPHARLRVDIDKTAGVPTRFVVQLERRVDGSWRQVVRFDHESENPMGHDITDEGLHMDVYRDGEKVRVKDDFPPVDLTHAPRYCIAYIERHAGVLLRRFERWHDLSQEPSGGTSP